MERGIDACLRCGGCTEVQLVTFLGMTSAVLCGPCRAAFRTEVDRHYGTAEAYTHAVARVDGATSDAERRQAFAERDFLRQKLLKVAAQWIKGAV